MPGGQVWSDEEDGLIRARYPVEGPGLVVSGRGERAVIARASRLGVKYEPGLSQRLTNEGFNPSEWDARQLWLKDGRKSVKLVRSGLDFKEILKDLKPGNYPKLAEPKKNGRMLEVAEVDAHFGKLAWAPESGADYDLKIADETHRAAALDFSTRLGVERFERVILLGGQDALHIANPEGTTSGGTQLDFDGRFQKIVKSRIEYEIWRVGLWLKKGPVTYINSPGNHSYVAEMMLCEVLKAWYKDCPQVQFMDSPADRQYLQFGKVGLGFSHGDKTKPQKARELFAAEAPKVWGSTEFREFHTGHLHAESVSTGPGCTCRVLKALCSADRWHRDNGYVALPGSQAFAWDKVKGLDFTLNRH